jgi:predicted transcriptional regulator
VRNYSKNNLYELEENGLTRIYTNDMLNKINKKDIRSVISWCKKNAVEIYSDSSGKFVTQAEFELAYNRPIIDRYKKKYGDQWVEIYNLAKENNLHLFERNENPSKFCDAYKPLSRKAQDFIKKCA